MQRRALLLSLALHAAVIGLMVVDFHFTREYTKAPPAILIVDLTKVKIADKTNLPQKTVVKKQVPKEQPKKEPPKIEQPPKESPKVEQPKKEPPKPTPEVDKPKVTPPEIQPLPEPKPEPKPAPVPKDAVAVKPKQEEKKKEPQKSTPQKPKPKKPEYNLKSLLASVDKVRQDAPTPQSEQPAQQKALDNGTEGRMDKLLTISDKDYIASKLRDCWNIDGGAQDIDEIIIEIRVLVNKDGTIRKDGVKIMNNMNLPAFKSLSESARRAIYICAEKGDESPFKILSNNYADHYNDWKELYLNFNPMNASIF